MKIKNHDRYREFYRLAPGIAQGFKKKETKIKLKKEKRKEIKDLFDDFDDKTRLRKTGKGK